MVANVGRCTAQWDKNVLAQDPIGPRGADLDMNVYGRSALIHGLLVVDRFGPLYKRIHKELDHDNDYQSIQKILHNVEKFNYSKDDLEGLISDIQALFNANGEHDVLEDNLLLALKKLLK